MSTLPISGPKARWFDANGDPLAGGLLYSYSAATSTPRDTFTTRAGNIANANPVVLNANGEADVWLTQGVLYKFVLANADDEIQWTVDNFPAGSGESEETDAAGTVVPGGRLSLASGDAVRVGDVTAATTVYYVPYKHNKVPLYDGSAWTLHTIATQLSQSTSDNTKSPAAVATTKCYDLFVWIDSGTLRLSRGPAWFSETARGSGAGTTELEFVDARLMNKYAVSNGPAAQRGLYVGTVRSDTSAQLTDSFANRHVWNTFNRVLRPMSVIEATASWTYATETWRQANAAAENQLDFVVGLQEEPVEAEVGARCKTIPTEDVEMVAVGIGLDSTTVNSATTHQSLSLSGTALAATSEFNAVQLGAKYQGFPGLGRHVLNWLEIASATKVGGGAATVFWYGTNDSSVRKSKSGIWGHLFA